MSGFCFLLPGLVVVLLLSALWRQGQTMAGLTTVLVVVKPVVAAVIWAFVGKLLWQQRQPWQRAMAVSAALGGLLHQFSPLVLPAGVLLLAAGVANAWRTAMGGTLLLLPGLAPWGAALEWVQAPWFWLVQLAGVFLQAGLLGFGGGLVIIPLLQDQVVGWAGSVGPNSWTAWPLAKCLQGRWCSPARLWAIKRAGLPEVAP